jgi:uncharacterized protein YqeY
MVYLLSVKDRIKEELNQEIEKEIVSKSDFSIEPNDFENQDYKNIKLSYHKIPSHYKISFLKFLLVFIKDKEYILNIYSQKNTLSNEEIYELFNDLVIQKLSQIDFLDSLKKYKEIYKELSEIAVIKYFLPHSLSKNEIEAIVKKEVAKYKEKSLSHLKKIMTEVSQIILKNHRYTQIDKANLAEIIKKILLSNHSKE